MQPMTRVFLRTLAVITLSAAAFSSPAQDPIPGIEYPPLPITTTPTDDGTVVSPEVPVVPEDPATPGDPGTGTTGDGTTVDDDVVTPPPTGNEDPGTQPPTDGETETPSKPGKPANPGKPAVKPEVPRSSEVGTQLRQLAQQQRQQRQELNEKTRLALAATRSLEKVERHRVRVEVLSQAATEREALFAAQREARMALLEQLDELKADRSGRGTLIEAAKERGLGEAKERRGEGRR